MPLAIVSFTGSDSDNIQAYFRLIELGSSAAGIGDHSRANPELERWITIGATTEADPGFDDCPTPRAGTAESEPDERSEAIVAKFTAYEQAYRTAIGGKRLTTETTLTLGASWEIHQLVSSAALELITSTKDIDLKSSPDDDDDIPVPR